MTAIAVAETDARTLGRSRILAVLRLHFANPTQMVWQPLGIFAFVFAVNWVIWFIASSADPSGVEGMSTGTSWSGASAFAFVWQLVVAVQAMNKTFPFALGLGSTRRDFYLGTALAMAVMSAGWAILIGVLALVEDATGGWVVGGHMFSVVYFGDDGPLARVWYVFLLMLFFAFVGTVAGSLFVRWRTWGLLGFGAVMAILLVGGLALASFLNGWAAIGRFFLSLGFAGAYPLLLIPIVVAGVIAWAALRGATARSAT